MTPAGTWPMVVSTPKLAGSQSWQTPELADKRDHAADAAEDLQDLTAMMNDPLADMLTRIRNATSIERPFVDMPYSKLKQAVAEALQREGYIWDFEVIEAQPRNVLRVNLKYGPNGERLIQSLKRVSSPGRRVYTSVEDLPNVLQGLGTCLLSTNKGVLSSREARAQNVGGELLAVVY